MRKAFSSFRNVRNRFPASTNLRIDGFLIKIRKCLIFASIHPPPSLNQDQGNVFTLRECAQSIPRMILPLYRSYRKKIFSENDPKWFHPPIKLFFIYLISRATLKKVGQ